MAPTLHGGPGRAATRRSLLAFGANGILAGGVVTAVGDLTAADPAAAATKPAANTNPASTTLANMTPANTTPATTTPAAAAAATPDWINVASSAYGADPTGASDSTAAFKSAIAAASANGGGVVYIPSGTYKISSTLTSTTVPVYFIGDGAWASIISFTGTGDCFRIYDSSAYGQRTKFAGGFIGITLDGSDAGAGSTGIHVGDLLQYELDLTVQNFYGTGSIGVYLDNNYYWTEQLFGRIYAQNCASHVVFDWTSATATTSSGSFERCDLDIYIDQDNAAFDGVVFQNGAFTANGSLKIRGNFGSRNTTAVTSAALRLTGYQSVNGYPSYSGIVDGMLDIGVECGSGTYTPQTIVFGAAGNAISACYGALNFGAAGNTFSESNNNGNVSNFIGLTSGDTSLPGQWATYGTGFPAGITGHVALRFLPTGHEVMVSWALTIASGTTLQSNESIVTVNSKFAYNDNKVIPGNSNGGGVTGNVYAPAFLTSKAAFQYCGPTYKSSGTSYWYGQGVYTLSLG